MKKKKVLIGLSGGVDSSVTAYLLQKQGFDVYGVSIQTCNNSHKEAEEIAKKLNIPFFTLDREKDFNKYVIAYFLNMYKEGKTPNPCVICNRYIKFQSLIDKADELNIPYIATGHYAKVKFDSKKERYLLMKGKDKAKDQSYMLYNLSQKQLSRTLFPLGKYTKSKVRKIAKQLGLSTADRKDSQDLCFIPDNNYEKYIEENSNLQSIVGDIINTSGEKLGTHKGIMKYTIGQRRGIEIAYEYPLYVIDIDPKKNLVTVGKEKELYKDQLIATDINLISIKNLEKEMRVDVKIRYSRETASAEISPLENNDILVKFKKKQRAITKGQAVVFYKKNIVIGGGIISEITS